MTQLDADRENEKFAERMTGLSGFTAEQKRVLEAAQAKSWDLVRRSQYPIDIDETDAKEVLASAVLASAKDGEWNPVVLAIAAVGRLRDTVQMRESAHRLTGNAEPN